MALNDRGISLSKLPQFGILPPFGLVFKQGQLDFVIRELLRNVLPVKFVAGQLLQGIGDSLPTIIG